MFAGQRQAPAPPYKPHYQQLHLANELIWAPEAQKLALPQMVEGGNWRTSLHASHSTILFLQLCSGLYVRVLFKPRQSSEDNHTAGLRRGKDRG